MKGIAAVAVVLSASVARASSVSYCPSSASNVCYSVGVPTTTASSGSGNIYFQISAPTTYAWVGFGMGSQMKGANIFVMYQDGNNNVTISPRLGTGHVEPTTDGSTAQVTLLAGSGVSGTNMIANVLCSNCESWTGGTLSTTSTAAPFIGAWKEGSSLASTSTSAEISLHDEYSQYSLDLSQATIEADSNPFTSASSSSSSNGTSSGGSSASNGSAPNKKIIHAHGIGMALVFAVLYPLGSAVMPLLGKWWFHGGWQGVSWLLMWACFGLGIFGAQERSLLFNNTHTLFGTVVVALLAVQPALGYIHHRQFIMTHSRGAFSYGHIWWGRILMVLGVINGGLGLQLTNADNSLNIAYAVVSAIMFLVYTVVKAFVSVRKQKSRSGGENGKYSQARSSRAEQHGDDVSMTRYASRRDDIVDGREK